MQSNWLFKEFRQDTNRPTEALTSVGFRSALHPKRDDNLNNHQRDLNPGTEQLLFQKSFTSFSLLDLPMAR